MSGFNPYDSLGSAGAQAHGNEVRFPRFCYIVFGIDLVLCLLRLFGVCLGVIDYADTRHRNPATPFLSSTIAEIATFAAIALFGILASALMMAEQRWALVLGVLTVLATLASIAVIGWRLTTMLHADALPIPPEERGRVIFGAVFATLIRLALLGVYIAALVVFARWASSGRTDQGVPQF